MTVHTPLHILIFSPEPRSASRVRRVLSDMFPNSQFVDCTKTVEVTRRLKETAFDLVILSPLKITQGTRRLFKAVKDHTTPMPVVALIKGEDQDKFHRLAPDLEADWGMILHDHVTDEGLGHEIHRTIRRFELRWELDHLRKAFQSSRLQYRNLFDEVPDLIFQCDRAGCLLDINETALRNFGLKKQEILLEPICETLGMKEDIFHDLVRCATDPSMPIEDVEVEFRPPGSQVVHGLMHLLALQPEPGRPVQFQGVIKDISYHKDLEQKLRLSEFQYKTLFELAQISSSSLKLEDVAKRSVKLIVKNCGAAGGLILWNGEADQLDVLSSQNFPRALERDYRTQGLIQLGKKTLGRAAIAGDIGTIDPAKFKTLHPTIAAWLDRTRATSLMVVPLAHSNPSVPNALMLLPFADDETERPSDELVLALAKTLEVGLNNCHLYTTAREAENKYRELWETAPAFFISYLKGGVIFEINQTAVRALGYKVQEMIGRNFAEFIEEEDRERFLMSHRKIVKGAKEQNYEIRLRKRSGESLIASFNSEPLTDGQGKTIGEKSVLYDITKDKLLEANLRDYSENLRREVAESTLELKQTTDFLNGILEGSTGNAILGLDERGTFVHFNRGAQLMFDYAPETMVHHKSLDALTDLSQTEASNLDSFLKLVDDNDVYECELKMRTGKSEEIDAHLSINRLQTSAPGNLAYVAIIRDITEQKKMQTLLKEYSENLEQIVEAKTKELDQKQVELIQSSKLATLGEMATGLAHELNQPLSGIRTRAQFLCKIVERGRATEAKIVSTQREIMKLVDRVSRIIQHMRVFARQDEQTFSSININQSVEGCLNLMGEQLRLHAIEYEVDIPSDPPDILGEPYQLEQVLLNLVGNARFAMDEKEARLRDEAQNGRPEYTKKLVLRLTQPSAEEICLSISDNGIGMTESQTKRVFEPFYTTKPVGEGTGLGLSISYGIIARHNGRIEVESSPGEGTTFRLYFPAHQKPRGVLSPRVRKTAVARPSL